MILEEKQQIRKIIKTTLTNYKDNFKKDSAIIMKLILESPDFIKANTILSYMALPDEVVLDNSKFATSKKVYIPKVHQENGTMDFYKFNENNLEKGAYNILEPAPNTKFSLEAPSQYGNILVLVPGRAFTIQGHRLGRGKGYYDKFLDKLFSLFETASKNKNKASGMGNVTLVGVCFPPQIVATLPTEAFDIVMDRVITTTSEE